MEFIALFLLAPLIWTSLGATAPAPTPAQDTRAVQVLPSVSNDVRIDTARPTVESQNGQVVVRPPPDANLKMIVQEIREGGRGPASSDAANSRPARRIEVIVSAP